jgi:hypothetical protein
MGDGVRQPMGRRDDLPVVVIDLDGCRRRGVLRLRAG